MDRPGDTQAIQCVGALTGSVALQAHEETHDSIFAAAHARIDAIAREWAEVVGALGAVVGPPAEQLPSATRIQGPMATAPIQLTI
jgi:hypothetical protein